MIKIGTNSQSIEHHHHHIHHLGNGACVDNTPFMTPAQSVENFYNNEDMLEDLDTADETLSVAGTEYSEASSVARSYTISHSHHSNHVSKFSNFSLVFLSAPIVSEQIEHQRSIKI